MTTPRFLVRETLAVGATVPLPAAASHHARRVLRLRADAAITLFDGNGNEFEALLVPDPRNASHSRATITRGGPVDREPGIRITLIQALSTQDKVDWLVEKAVEIGAHRLILAPAARSVVRLDSARRERRAERLREIVAAACCQCGRNRLPGVDIAASLDAALQAGKDAAACWIFDPGASTGLLADRMRSRAPGPMQAQAVSLAIGPEGGFTGEELALAHSLGYLGASLGRRVLRTETAGLVAMSALLALEGEFS